MWSHDAYNQQVIWHHMVLLSFSACIHAQLIERRTESGDDAEYHECNKCDNIIFNSKPIKMGGNCYTFRHTTVTVSNNDTYIGSTFIRSQ